ncbi:leptin receptor isoform 1-T1 [Synchiropus picturatus]
MVRCLMLPLLVHVVLVFHGSICVDQVALDLPWQDQLCCHSTPVHPGVEAEGSSAEMKRSESDLPHRPHCMFSRSTSPLLEQNASACVNVLCFIEENWEYLTCHRQSLISSGNLSITAVAVHLQWLKSPVNASGNAEYAFNHPVRCASEESLPCSLASDTIASVAMVTFSVFNETTKTVLLNFPARPAKPSPPINLSYNQTVEAMLFLLWEVPDYSDYGLLKYQVRYAVNASLPVWQVINATLDKPQLVLDLKPKLLYIVQVRCSTMAEPPLWSDWSDCLQIFLDTVSYIPEKIVAQPGQNVTVYCLFNDHNSDASEAMWTLNHQQHLHRSQYHQINQWVSQITVRPSENGMYDLLQCTQEWTIPYSQIYVEGASIDIKCVTNGDIDAMDCSWTTTQLTTPIFRSRWADMLCDEMKALEGAGVVVGSTGPVCHPSWSGHCTIRPLRMNCYKLWLEIESEFGPIRSKAVYLSPADHIKAHPPTNIKALSRSTGVLKVTWDPPRLPVNGLQCQLRLLLPSAARAQPEWKVYSPLSDSWMEVAIPDMCWVYSVQVRCVHAHGSGYWGDWSELVYSMPENSRAPERGPDFWRILQKDQQRTTTNVTLLFKPIQAADRSYCIDGFIVHRQLAGGGVNRDRIKVVSSYSFEWNHDVQTVTVEAFNNKGSSADNIQMTLERQPKRRCVRSFHALIINSTCVSLLWTLLDNSSVPLSMVVQWSSPKQQDHHKGEAHIMWARVPYTDRTVYLKGDFYGFEEMGFQLFPVFADGEGKSVYTVASKGELAPYVMLMIVSLISVFLFVSLILSQNKMKRFVWKEVPNPNKCSWARGLDFKRADTFNQVFQASDGLPAWPLLLPPEHISQVCIVDKMDHSAFTPPATISLNCEPAIEPVIVVSPSVDGESLLHATVDQSSVTYASVLLADPHQYHIQYKDGSGSSDEGNYSANNSDISGQWELSEPRRSCSLNSVDEFYEVSEPENDSSGVIELKYLSLNSPEGDEEITDAELLKNSAPCLEQELMLSDGLQLYMPQFRTAH